MRTDRVECDGAALLTEHGVAVAKCGGVKVLRAEDIDEAIALRESDDV